MKKVIISALILFAYFNLYSKEDFTKLVASEKSFVVDLSGKWQRSIDGTNWNDIKLPTSENESNSITYQRIVRIERSLIESMTWHLHFLGIDHQVEVFFNDQFVGRYFGGMSPVKVRIPSRMVTGETNTIRLKISGAKSYAKQIRKQNLFAEKVYTGVIRELFLVGTPHIWVGNVNTSTEFNADLTSAKLSADVKISSGKISVINSSSEFQDSTSKSNSERAEIEAFVQLVDDQGDTVATSTKQIITIESERTLEKKFSLEANNIKLWDISNPTLYKLVVNITKNGKLVDKKSIDFAFRELAIKTLEGVQSVYFNNEPFEIKGISYIEDHINTNQTLSKSVIEEDVALIKRLGANVIRVKYSSPHPYLVELCDKNGILLFVELPVYDVPSQIIEINEIKVHIKNIANQLIESYNNHPSIAAWGISDGLMEGNPSFEKFSSELAELFRNNSQKLIYKIVPFGSEKVETSNVDLLGFKNYNHDIDFNQVKNELLRLKNLSSGKPIFMVYGTSIQEENRNGYSDPLSVEFQAYNILNSYRIVKEIEAAGSLINTFNDYNLDSPLLIMNNKNQYVNTSGLFDRERQQRVSFNTLQSLFNSETEPLLNAGSYTLKTPISYVIVGVILLIILVLLLNRFKRFREYLFRSLLRPYNFYADIRDQRIMSNLQTILLGVLIAVTAGMYIASIFYFYRSNEAAQYIFMILVQSDTLKEYLYRLIWMPELSMLIISIFILVMGFVTAIFIRFFALLMRARIYLNDCFTIVVWSSIPFLFLLPISIILVRILVLSPELVIVFLSLIALVALWVFARVLRSISVVFDQPALKVYFIGFIVFILALGTPLAIYQLNNSIVAYAEYFFNVLLKMNA